MKKLVLAAMSMLSLSAAPSAVAQNWDYNEKLAAQSRCERAYNANRVRISACEIGVTLYGDGRRWPQLNWSEDHSYDSCAVVCRGAAQNADICRDGCNIAKEYDQ
jgi:hypothetical protein